MVTEHLGKSEALRLKEVQLLRHLLRTTKNVQSSKTVTSAITLSNVTRSPDIIILPTDTKTPVPNKPSCCSETEDSTVKKNNLFHYLSSQYGVDQTQQTAQLYGPVPHKACVNTRHLARGGPGAHTALYVHVCVSAYRLPRARG